MGCPIIIEQINNKIKKVFKSASLLNFEKIKMSKGKKLIMGNIKNLMSSSIFEKSKKIIPYAYLKLKLSFEIVFEIFEIYLKVIKKITDKTKPKKYFLFLISISKDPTNNAIDDCLKKIGNTEKKIINLFLLKIIKYEIINTNENKSIS